MRNIILAGAFIILLLSCETEQKNFRFTLEPTNDSVYIRLGKEEFNFTVCNQFFSENDNDYLAVRNGERNSIFIYNLNQQKLYKKLAIDMEGVNAFPHFTSFLIKNFDTIILLSPWPPEIAIANGEGVLIKKTSIEKDFNGKSLRPKDGINGERPTLTNNTLYISQQLLFSGYNGKFDENRQQESDIAISVDLESGIVKSLPLKYPNELVGLDIFNMTSLWEKGYKGCYVYTSSLLPFFVTQDFLEFKKTPIQTNYKFELPENLMKFGNDIPGTYNYVFKKDWFRGLVYDKYGSVITFSFKKGLMKKSKISKQQFFIQIVL